MLTRISGTFAFLSKLETGLKTLHICEKRPAVRQSSPQRQLERCFAGFRSDRSSFFVRPSARLSPGTSTHSKSTDRQTDRQYVIGHWKPCSFVWLWSIERYADFMKAHSYSGKWKKINAQRGVLVWWNFETWYVKFVWLFVVNMWHSYLLGPTHSMEQSPFWEANSRSSIKKFSVLCVTGMFITVFTRANRSAPLVCILN
jgi:hypothetical protein